MPTYRQILDISVEDYVEKSVIGYRSFENYSRELRNLLKFNNIEQDCEFDHKFFRQIQEEFRFKSKSQEAAVKFFYKVYMFTLIKNLDLSLPNLIKICLSGMYDRRFKGDFDIKHSSYNYVIQNLKLSSEYSRKVERLFYLPIKSLEIFQIVEKSKSEIPTSWWPIGFTRRHSKKWDYIESIWISEDNNDDEEGYERFLEIFSGVEKNEHFNGPICKIINYRKENFKPLNLSQEIKDDLENLARFKISSPDLNKSKRWTSNHTKTINISYIKTYYRFLISNPDKLRLLENFNDSDLSLACFSSHEMIIEYAKNYFSVTGIYSSSIVSLIKMALSMLDSESGWIARNAEYRKKLPKTLRSEGKSLKAWKEHCKMTQEKLRVFFKNQVEGNVHKSVNSQERAKQILKLDSPIFAVRDGLEQSYQEILLNWEMSEDFALQVQYHLLVFMLCCFPLRAKNWSLLYNISKNSDQSFIKKNNDGSLCINIKTKDLKNRSSKTFKNLPEIELELSLLANKLGMSKHLDILERFAKELRPLLSKDRYFFSIRSGGKFATPLPSQITEMVYKWTRKYISSTSKFSSRIPGLPPLRAHIFRNIVATHYIKHNIPKIAIYTLIDSESVVREHYVFDDFNSAINREIRNLTFDSK